MIITFTSLLPNKISTDKYSWWTGVGSSVSIDTKDLSLVDRYDLEDMVKRGWLTSSPLLYDNNIRTTEISYGIIGVDSSGIPTTLLGPTGSTSPIAGSEGAGIVNSVAGKHGNVILSSVDVGLENVDNTSDINKPLSTAAIAALSNKVDSTTFNSALSSKQNNLTAGSNISIQGSTISATNSFNYTAAPTAPSSPNLGDEWYDTSNETLYVRAYDGTSTFWVSV